jgi:non-ribosomal peptide synthetase component F
VDIDNNLLIHNGFMQQALRKPNRTAIESEDGALTYHEVLERALQLASAFDAAIVPGNRRPIMLCGAKSTRSIIGMVAALMTGRAYTYACPRQRAARIEKMIEQLRPSLIVDLGSSEWDHDPKAIALDAPTIQYPETLAESPFEPIADPSGAAYVFFSSGSTGVPKGAVISHRAAVAAQRKFIADIELNAEDRLCTEMAFNYDVSTIDIFSGLAVGATLDITPEPVVDDPLRLFGRLVERRLTYLFTCPTVARMILEAAPDAADRLSEIKLCLTGEMIPDRLAELMAPLIRRGHVWNQYGATEFPFGLSKRLAPEDIQRPNVVFKSVEGDPVRERLSDTGEIVISGPGLFSGYVVKEFDFCAAMPGVQSYATADRVEPVSSRELQIFGRIDRQCRKGGYRIELREIECAAERHLDVELAYALYRPERDRIELHVSLRGAAPATLAEVELQSFIRRLVPDYMVPEKVFFIDVAPRTIGGKKQYKDLVQSIPL